MQRRNACQRCRASTTRAAGSKLQWWPGPTRGVRRSRKVGAEGWDRVHQRGGFVPGRRRWRATTFRESARAPHTSIKPLRHHVDDRSGYSPAIFLNPEQNECRPRSCAVGGHSRHESSAPPENSAVRMWGVCACVGWVCACGMHASMHACMVCGSARRTDSLSPPHAGCSADALGPGPASTGTRT